MGSKNEGARKQQCTTNVSSRKEEVNCFGSLGGSHLHTAGDRRQQEAAHPQQYKLHGANNLFSTLTPTMHPPTSTCLHSDLTASQPFPVLPNVQTHPLRAIPAGAHHHTASPVPTNYYTLPPTVSFRPQPLPAAIPLGAPRTTPPSQDASCLREDHLREGQVTTFGDTRTFTEHEMVDASLQTSLDMHSHPPAHLVMEVS